MILLTQSCDALDSNRLVLAPLRPFAPKEKQPSQLWPQINGMANTLAVPTMIYVPDEPKFGFPRRYIDLGAPITVRREDVEQFTRIGKRKATLGPDGLGYLQFRLTLLFSRFARDDFAWPSRNDLDLKREHLEKVVENRKNQIASNEGTIGSPKTSQEQKDRSTAALDRFKQQQVKDEESLRLTILAIDRYDVKT